MYSYIAKQPILNSKQETVAFELLFRDGESNSFPDIDPDKATSKIIVDNQLTLGLDALTGACPAYINFHADALINLIPTFLDPKKVVVEILEDVPITNKLINACKLLKEKGYTLALDDYDFDDKWDVFFPFVDIIKVDILEVDLAKIIRSLPKLKKHKLTLLAEKVEERHEFEKLQMLGFTMFQGYFFAKPEMVKKRNILSSKKHMIDLMEHVCSPDFDIDAISEVFSTDLGLSYKLLRFINSPTYGPSKEISSLRHALVYIGELELRKFIALLILADLSEGKPNEIIRISLVRAKFCEKISVLRKDVQNPPKSFLTGMLSHIDGILDQSIASVMDVLPVHSDIKVALVQKDNYLSKYLDLCMVLEQGKWQQAKNIAKLINLTEEDYLDLYQESISWADELLSCQ